MAEIVKPDMTALWASGGAVVAPSRNKINEGWTAEVPPHQWENFVQLRQDEAIAYLFQRGIAEWDNTTEYFADKSVVIYNSILYIATVNNQNTLPTNTSRWRPITGNATTSTAGLMSPEDKLKLDGIEAGAQKNVVLSVAGKVGAVSLSKSDVGLSNVDNTTDAQKPLSNAAINALNTKAPLDSPTFTGTVSGVTKSMVGLGNVDNTSDLSKPISTATQTALNSKANTHNPTFTGTVSGITKGMVGLGNVNNTSDLNKPISTATQNALNSKANTSTQIIAGTGLTGGGTLAANRTISIDPNYSGNVPKGGIIMWSGSTSNIPSGWALCNGANGTPDLRGRFVIGAGGSYNPGNTGGGSIPSHSHGVGSLATNSTGSHSHTGTAASAGSHNHSGTTNSAGAHSHTLSMNPESSGGSHARGSSYSGGSLITSTAGAHTHSLSIDSSGSHTHSVSVTSAGAHTHTISGSTAAAGSGSEVIAKYYALCYIMRV